MVASDQIRLYHQLKWSFHHVVVHEAIMTEQAWSKDHIWVGDEVVSLGDVSKTTVATSLCFLARGPPTWIANLHLLPLDSILLTCYLHLAISSIAISRGSVKMCVLFTVMADPHLPTQPQRATAAKQKTSWMQGCRVPGLPSRRSLFEHCDSRHEKPLSRCGQQQY